MQSLSLTSTQFPLISRHPLYSVHPHCVPRPLTTCRAIRAREATSPARGDGNPLSCLPSLRFPFRTFKGTRELKVKRSRTASGRATAVFSPPPPPSSHTFPHTHPTRRHRPYPISHHRDTDAVLRSGMASPASGRCFFWSRRSGDREWEYRKVFGAGLQAPVLAPVRVRISDIVIPSPFLFTRTLLPLACSHHVRRSTHAPGNPFSCSLSTFTRTRVASAYYPGRLPLCVRQSQMLDAMILAYLSFLPLCFYSIHFP
ncbi:hypothetical protein B0H12DRAFT_1171555 [Mycena haematopus]|nr:hypothetical protein B0H12DRAFT_1171555 [Mycena haematopus]